VYEKGALIFAATIGVGGLLPELGDAEAALDHLFGRGIEQMHLVHVNF